MSDGSVEVAATRSKSPIKLEADKPSDFLCENECRDSFIISGAIIVNRTPNQGITILLYIVGIALVIAALIVVLKGAGVLTQIPNYVIWGLILFAVGAGIISGINSMRR